MSKIIPILLFFSFFLVESGFAQKKNVWNTLALMKYERQYAESDGIGAQAGQGRFLPMIEQLNGTEIEVKGYIIPLSGKKAQSHFMFSAYPFASCFFCGKAGPESVIEVFMKDDKKVEYSDNSITIKGVFKFLPNKMDDIMYQLEFGEVVE